MAQASNVSKMHDTPFEASPFKLKHQTRTHGSWPLNHMSQIYSEYPSSMRLHSVRKPTKFRNPARALVTWANSRYYCIVTRDSGLPGSATRVTAQTTILQQKMLAELRYCGVKPRVAPRVWSRHRDASVNGPQLDSWGSRRQSGPTQDNEARQL